MHRRLRLLAFGLLATLFLPAGLPGQDTKKKKSTSALAKKADPAGTGPLMGQLRALFTEWDGNDDDFLDGAELSRSLRNANVKATTLSAKSRAKVETFRPDELFLAQVDRDGDDKASRDEFLNWAREYAVLRKNLASAEMKVAKAQADVLTRTTTSSRVRAELELQNERQAYLKLVAQLPAFEKALRPLLDPKPAPAKKGKK
jgi:hypothetical protein